MWAEPGTGTWRHTSRGCNKGCILPQGSYEQTGHQMIWFNFKRTCVGNPCSSAKPAETFSPSTCPDYQCEFLHCISSLPLCDWHICHSGTTIPNASQPSCAVCGVSDCWQLGAAVSRVVLFVVLTPLLLHQSEGAGLPPSWKHLDNAVVGHMYCRQEDLRGQGAAARNFKWRLPENILHPLDYPSFTGWHRQQRKLLRWPEFHIKELTFSACLQTEWMIFWSNWIFLPGLFREDFYFIPGPLLKGDHDLPYIVWGVVWSFCSLRASLPQGLFQRNLYGKCIINRAYFSFQVDIILFIFFIIILFIWCHGNTSAQAGSIQLHVKKGNFIQAVLPQPLICLVAEFNSENLFLPSISELTDVKHRQCRSDGLVVPASLPCFQLLNHI